MRRHNVPRAHRALQPGADAQAAVRITPGTSRGTRTGAGQAGTAMVNPTVAVAWSIAYRRLLPSSLLLHGLPAGSRAPRLFMVPSERP